MGDWIQESHNISIKDKYFDKYKDIDYPKPIVDYSTMKEKALDMYKNN